MNFMQKKMTWNNPSPADQCSFPPELVFEAGLRHHHIANTAYPIHHQTTMRPYRVARQAVEAAALAAWQEIDTLGLYVHVPFCAARCKYCEYTVVERNENDAEDAYFDALLGEFELERERMNTTDKTLIGFDIGGGTPAFAQAANIQRVIDAARASFRFKAGMVISIETTPIIADRQPEKIRAFKEMGIDRISMGVQSFEDPILRRMNRPHDARQALDAIQAIHDAGIGSVSIDLIYGYLGQTMGSWYHTLQVAMGSGADAWHLYRLRVERYGEVQGAILNEYQHRHQDRPSAETTWLMKMLGWLMSEANGHHQHFARIFCTGREHITHFMWDYCCELTDVVGTGPSAWSNHHRTFTLNHGRSQRTWREQVRGGMLPVERGILRDVETEARRSLLLPLKNDRVYKRKFQRRMGFSINDHFGPELARLRDLGLLQEDTRSWCLTERGRFFADEALWQLTQRRYVPFPEVHHPLMPA